MTRRPTPTFLRRAVLETLPGLVACLVPALLAGCAGYRLGSMLPPDVKTIHIPAFVNGTGEPRIEIEVTNATIREFQKDGTLRVTPPADAALLLEATVTGFTIAPLRYERDEPTKGAEYRLRLTVSAVVRRAATREVVGKHPEIAGETWFTPSGDLTSAKLEAVPEAAKQLAHNIVERVVEAW
ncbi:MAG: LptE family protein [Kiritimatiellae bacterium]|nr:LptE family protein [Kiritimatiellia bacterium]